MAPKRGYRKRKTSKFTKGVLVPSRLHEPGFFDPENSLGSTEDQVTSETPAQIVGLKSISAGFDDEFEDDNSESLGELFQKSNDLNHSFTSNTSTISSSTATSSLPSTEEMRRIVESNKIRLIGGCCDLKDLSIGNIFL